MYTFLIMQNVKTPSSYHEHEVRHHLLLQVLRHGRPVPLPQVRVGPQHVACWLTQGKFHIIIQTSKLRYVLTRDPSHFFTNLWSDKKPELRVLAHFFLNPNS